MHARLCRLLPPMQPLSAAQALLPLRAPLLHQPLSDAAWRGPRVMRRCSAQRPRRIQTDRGIGHPRLAPSAPLSPLSSGAMRMPLAKRHTRGVACGTGSLVSAVRHSPALRVLLQARDKGGTHSSVTSKEEASCASVLRGSGTASCASGARPSGTASAAAAARQAAAACSSAAATAAACAASRVCFSAAASEHHALSAQRLACNADDQRSKEA
jgi:hypothetical protein